LTWRVLGSGPAPDRWWRTSRGSAPQANGSTPAGAAASRARQVHLPGHGLLECRILTREALSVESEVSGPCLVEDGSSTIVVPPRATGAVDLWGNLVVELAEPC
jgi:N-methylhydantoinase A/oxoprolinase/acetone carboxylase beta subunit